MSVKNKLKIIIHKVFFVILSELLLPKRVITPVKTRFKTDIVFKTITGWWKRIRRLMLKAKNINCYKFLTIIDFYKNSD